LPKFLGCCNTAENKPMEPEVVIHFRENDKELSVLLSPIYNLKNPK